MLKDFIRVAAPAFAMIFSFSCSSPHLPRAEQLMLDDYDFMTRTLTEVFPATVPVKESYGIDVPQIIFQSREKINARMTEADFAEFLDTTLRSCKWKHMQVNSRLYGLDEKSRVRKLLGSHVSPEAIRKTYEISEQIRQKRTLPPKTIDLAYFDGAYYSRYDFTVNGAAYDRGLKLVAVDGRKPLEIIAEYQDKLDSFDYRHKIFYADAFNTGAGANFYRFMPAPQDGVRKFVFQSSDGKDVEIAVANADSVVNKTPENGFSALGPKVIYLESRKILYIRIPAMNEDDIPFYDKEIHNRMTGREIAAVVLDVRNNTGGSDLVWQRILEFFVPKLDVSFTLVTTPSPIANEFMSQARTALTGQRILTKGFPLFVPYLGLNEMPSYSLNINSKAPGGKDRPVYIITHDVYGSTGNLLSVAERSPHVTTVGLCNPVPLGMATNAFFFSLPHSQLVISLTLQLDLTGCENAEDVMHTKVDIEVPFTAGEFIDYQNQDNIRNLPDYLVNRDPFFRKILDSRKPPEVEKKPEVEKPAAK